MLGVGGLARSRLFAQKDISIKRRGLAGRKRRIIGISLEERVDGLDHFASRGDIAQIAALCWRPKLCAFESPCTLIIDALDCYDEHRSRRFAVLRETGNQLGIGAD